MKQYASKSDAGHRLLPPEELGARWGVTEARLAALRHKGEGPAFLRIGGQVRYSVADIEAYENERRFVRTGQRA